MMGCFVGMRLWAFIPVLLLVGCSEPSPEPALCADGELDDDGVCVPEACGVGLWGGLEPHSSESTFYVLGSAEAPGDGSAEAPFPRLSSALEAAVEISGGRVLIGGGRYLDHLSFSRAHDGLELIGRCTELSIVDGEGLSAPTLSIFASSVVVRSLTITGGRPGIIAGEVPGAPGLVLRGNDLVIESNGGYGVLATGTGVLVDLAESVILDVFATNDLSPGRGIGVEQDARLVGQGLRVEDVVGTGVQVLGGSAEIEDSLVWNGSQQQDGSFGRGLHVVGGELTLRGTRVGDHPERGALVESGGMLTLVDSEILGGGVLTVQVLTGGALTAERSRIEAPSGLAVQVHGANSFLDLSSTTVEAADGATQGPLVSVEGGAALFSRGLVLSGGLGTSLHLAGANTVGSLSDLDVLATRGGEGSVTPGIAVLVSDSATLEGDDITIEGSAGPGLVAARGATARCISCSVTRAAFAAAMVSGGAELRLEGGQLRDTAVHSEWQGGVGALGIGGGAGETRLQIDDTAIIEMAHAGVAVRGAGAYRIASAVIETSGLESAAPGLLAIEGTGFWQGAAGPGLFVFDVTFRQLPNDAILMDGATGTISGSSFDGVGQLELYTQNCGGVLPPDVAEMLQTNDCVGPPRVLGPPLDWPAPPVAPGVWP